MLTLYAVVNAKHFLGAYFMKNYRGLAISNLRLKCSEMKKGDILFKISPFLFYVKITFSLDVLPLHGEVHVMTLQHLHSLEHMDAQVLGVRLHGHNFHG